MGKKKLCGRIIDQSCCPLCLNYFRFSKDGGRFDLAIALGILAAGGQVPREALRDCEFLGELALSGELRPVTGVLPALLRARHHGRCVIVPIENAQEAALIGDVDVRVARTLADVCAHLRGAESLSQPIADNASVAISRDEPDLADVRGQLQARRALEIAAVGAHHLLMLRLISMDVGSYLR